MKKYLVGIWFSLPVQLCLLHFRKYQVLLLFWYILFATVTGNFMATFGASSLYLAPEYLDAVTPISTAIVGFAIGVFIMGWNITTFILHSKNLKFLATTAQPFLKYCINNAIIPLLFLLVYAYSAIAYASKKEFLPSTEILLLVGGFIAGVVLSIAIAFLYFFGADKTIYYTMSANIKTANQRYDHLPASKKLPKEQKELRVDWFLTAKFQLRKPREVRHYSQDFLDSIFKRHHFAAVLAILLAFLFLILVGTISDTRLFQLPAAASITILFTILIAVVAGITLFLSSWSIPVVVLMYLLLNWLYQEEILDPRNKAYGLNYQNKTERPSYNKDFIKAMSADSNIAKDKAIMMGILEKWKAKQGQSKPVLYLINTSGGGTRSASFTMSTMQELDSLYAGNLMKETFLINGASGGLLGAAYFRELYLQKTLGKPINLQDKKWLDNISKDLLNPLFSSFVARDIMGPVQKFEVNGHAYAKDRGYAFEQKLNQNTEGILDKSIQDYQSPEVSASIPTLFFNSVISRDGRKMIISTNPVRYLMKAVVDSTRITPSDPDAVDFQSMFVQQDAGQIQLLSALRMNATFPYVLPNVWLPTNPIIDVMDAGLRDNFGQETAMRFLDHFQDWIKANTSAVVLIQIRDRSLSDWDKPYESKSFLDLLTKPFLLLQNNWYKLQDYYQYDQLAYLQKIFGNQFHRVCFQYVPEKKEAAAALSFHLTSLEKRDIQQALKNPSNQLELQKLESIRKMSIKAESTGSN
jgi:hypothetical protein